MLFKVEAGKNIFDLNPELKALAEFANLTDRQMTYVALCTDYSGPFRKLSAEECKFQAALEAGYKLEKGTTRLDSNGRSLVGGKVGAVEAAIKRYKELQKDEDYEAWLSLKLLIAQITELNNKKDKTVAELEKAIKFTKDLPSIMDTKKKLEEILNLRGEDLHPIAAADDDDVKHDELSTLDLYNEEEND